MDDVSKIECLLESISNYMQVAMERNKERDNYHKSGGMSWGGYFGHREEQRVEEAAKEVKKYFREAILEITKEKQND